MPEDAGLPDQITADHIVAANVRLWRHQRGLTLNDLADRLTRYTGTKRTPQTIGEWEYSATKVRARPTSAQELIALADIFGIALTMLFIAPTKYKNIPVRGADDKRVGTSWLADVATAGGDMTTAWRFLQLNDGIESD
jgi:transcriptional regulator with XRE-family HTH domain